MIHSHTAGTASTPYLIAYIIYYVFYLGMVYILTGGCEACIIVWLVSCYYIADVTNVEYNRTKDKREISAEKDYFVPYIKMPN